MNQAAIPILTAAFVSCIMLLAMRWAPWSQSIKNNRMVQYVLGVLGLLLPFSYLLVMWKEWMILTAIWSITIAGGAVILAARELDVRIARDERLEAAEREASELRPEGKRGTKI